MPNHCFHSTTEPKVNQRTKIATWESINWVSVQTANKRLFSFYLLSTFLSIRPWCPSSSSLVITALKKKRSCSHENSNPIELYILKIAWANRINNVHVIEIDTRAYEHVAWQSIWNDPNTPHESFESYWLYNTITK